MFRFLGQKREFPGSTLRMVLTPITSPKHVEVDGALILGFL